MSTRSVVLTAMRCLGLMKLYRHANRGRIPILMFHGVEDASSNGACRPLRRRLACDDFDRYIRVLSKCFDLVSLEDAFEMLMGRKTIERRPLVLTLDDAYRDNATAAWTVLKRHNVTATFFVPTGYIETGKAFWADRLDCAVQHLPTGLEFVRLGERRYPILGTDRPAQRSLFWRLKGACEALGQQKAIEAVEEIEQQAVCRLADSPGKSRWAGFMTWEQIRSMQDQGASFGSHTVSHCLLGESPVDQVRAELAESKATLERRTGKACLAFAYPAGQFTPATVKMAREAGYRLAVTTVERAAGMSDSAMLLPRIGVSGRSLSSADLLARASGLSAALAHLRKRGSSTG